jgi:hypothetical protein
VFFGIRILERRGPLQRLSVCAQGRQRERADRDPANEPASAALRAMPMLAGVLLRTGAGNQRLAAATDAIR